MKRIFGKFEDGILTSVVSLTDPTGQPGEEGYLELDPSIDYQPQQYKLVGDEVVKRSEDEINAWDAIRTGAIVPEQQS